MTRHRDETQEQEFLVKLLCELDYVEAVGQFHPGAAYEEVTVYLNEIAFIDVRSIGGDGVYNILCINPMEPCIELEIQQYPSQQ